MLLPLLQFDYTVVLLGLVPAYAVAAHFIICNLRQQHLLPSFFSRARLRASECQNFSDFSHISCQWNFFSFSFSLSLCLQKTCWEMEEQDMNRKKERERTTNPMERREEEKKVGRSNTPVLYLLWANLCQMVPNVAACEADMQYKQLVNGCGGS